MESMGFHVFFLSVVIAITITLSVLARPNCKRLEVTFPIKTLSQYNSVQKLTANFRKYKSFTNITESIIRTIKEFILPLITS